MLNLLSRNQQLLRILRMKILSLLSVLLVLAVEGIQSEKDDPVLLCGYVPKFCGMLNLSRLCCRTLESCLCSPNIDVTKCITRLQPCAIRKAISYFGSNDSGLPKLLLGR